MAQLTFRKQKKRMNYDLLRVILTWTFEILIVGFVAFVLVWFWGLRVSIIGDSMKPQMANGDIVLVNRIAYNMGTPKRGDIVAFQPDGHENAHYYVKRIVGLPGEKIEVKQGELLVNGEKIREKYKTTEIIELGLLEEPIVLGNNEYFLLGDDRQNSEDSRSLNIGNVKRSDIVGKDWFDTSGKRFGFVK